MVNFGLLVAEIGLLVWGTPANFNGFRIFAALLDSIPVVSVSPAKLCGGEQRAPLVFSRAAITLGIGPHSSLEMLCTCDRGYIENAHWIKPIWHKAVHITLVASQTWELTTEEE